MGYENLPLGIQKILKDIQNNVRYEQPSKSEEINLLHTIQEDLLFLEKSIVQTRHGEHYSPFTESYTQGEQNTRKLPAFLVSIYTRISNLENAITKTEALYNEIDLKLLELLESFGFISLSSSYRSSISKRLRTIQKVLAQELESAAENIFTEKQNTPKNQPDNKLQELKKRLKEEQEQRYNSNIQRVKIPITEKQIQRKPKNTYVPRKKTPTEEEQRKLKAYIEERERINKDLLYQQRQEIGFNARQKLLNSKCGACGKIPDPFGRCGCS